jgi:hypothetical protein
MFALRSDDQAHAHQPAMSLPLSCTAARAKSRTVMKKTFRSPSIDRRRQDRLPVKLPGKFCSPCVLLGKQSAIAFQRANLEFTNSQGKVFANCMTIASGATTPNRTRNERDRLAWLS